MPLPDLLQGRVSVVNVGDILLQTEVSVGDDEQGQGTKHKGPRFH